MKIIARVIRSVKKEMELQVLKKELETTPMSTKRLFLEGEIAYFNNNYYQAYSKFSTVVGLEPEGKQKELAKLRLRQCSYYFINLAEKYLAAAVGKKKNAFLMSKYNRSASFKFGKEVFDKMRKALKAGNPKVYNLKTAYNVIGRPWDTKAQRCKGVNIDKLTWDEQKVRMLHMPFIIKLANIAEMNTPEQQNESLRYYAHYDRKMDFRRAANILYRESMKGDMRSYIYTRQHFDSYWKNKRKHFSNLSWKTRNKAKEQAKKLAKKASGKKWATMSEAEKNMKIEHYEHLLLESAGEMAAGKVNFKKFLKGARHYNEGAKKYDDMNDPFDEWFNLSDEGWDTAKEWAGEAVILGCSGGIRTSIFG
jgi:hypothetical protein